MQTGKNAMESVKETASNVAASARSGMEKTKATLQGQGEKMTAHSPQEKAIAEQRMEERKVQAELNKQGAQIQNAGQHRFNTAAQNTTQMGPGYTAGPEHMSTVPGGHGMSAGNPMSGTTTGTTGVTTRSRTNATGGGFGTGKTY